MHSMAARLRRFWFRFEGDPIKDGFGLGCGVTAWSEQDALELLRTTGPFHSRQMPKIAELTVDVDVSTFDRGHVLPNMEPPNRRGVWYPRGFSLP
jgi:hypothetical protein